MSKSIILLFFEHNVFNMYRGENREKIWRGREPQPSHGYNKNMQLSIDAPKLITKNSSYKSVIVLVLWISVLSYDKS